MITLHSITKVAALALGAILILACGGISSVSELLPGNKSTPTSVLAPTNTPVVPTPTNVPVIAATITPTRSSGSAPAASVALPAAIAKTRGATVFKTVEEMTMDQPFGAIKDNTTMVRLDGEFNGKDAHIRIGGTLVAFFNIEPPATLEVIQAGGKAYAHGPASGIGAPENRWYVLPAGPGMSIAPNPFDTFDKLLQLKPDYASFSYDRSVMNGLSCTIYKADKNVAYNLWSGALFSATGVAPVIDDGSIEMTVCNDGYLHGLIINLTGHDPKSPDKKGKAYFLSAFRDFDAKIAITAPADAVPAVAPTNPFASNTPTPRPLVVAPTLIPGGTTKIEGDWEGTTSTDAPISFTVKNNTVTFASINLFARNGSCSGSTSLSMSVADGTISNNAFSAQMKSSSGVQITFSGTFSSGQATGTVQASGELPCDVPEIKTTWSARNTSIAIAPTKPAATVPAAPTKSIAPQPTAPTSASDDPVSIVNAFFNAINAKNIDAALAFADDDLIYSFGSATNDIGKANLKGYLTTQAARGMTYTLSNFQAVGTSIVKFTARTSDGIVYSSSQAILDDGIIQMLMLK